jgi:hypothetical protein
MQVHEILRRDPLSGRSPPLGERRTVLSRCLHLSEANKDEMNYGFKYRNGVMDPFRRAGAFSSSISPPHQRLDLPQSRSASARLFEGRRSSLSLQVATVYGGMLQLQAAYL